MKRTQGHPTPVQETAPATAHNPGHNLSHAGQRVPERHCEIHLLCDIAGGPDSPSGGTGSRCDLPASTGRGGCGQRVVIPAGWWAVVGRGQIVACESPVGVVPGPEAILYVETVVRGSSPPFLVVVEASGARSLRVNGHTRPSLSVLHANDWVQWGEEVFFEVGLYHQPILGSPPRAWVGRECPVCQVRFEGTERCYGCVCGAVLHCDAEATEGLGCAQVREMAGCPVCRRPIDLEAGYRTRTEVDHV